MANLLQILGDKVVERLMPADVRTATAQLIQILRKRSEAQLISSERQRELERICLELREKHQTDGTFNFEAAFSDYNVRYLEDEMVFDPKTWPTNDGRYFMLLHPFGTQRYKDNIKAHELGHVVLNHELEEKAKGEHTEQEADYFAGKLIGNYSIRWNAVQTMGLIIHGLEEHRQDFQRYCNNPKLYDARLIAKLLKE